MKPVPCPTCGAPLRVMVDLTVLPALAVNANGAMVVGALPRGWQRAAAAESRETGVYGNSDVLCVGCGYASPVAALPR